MTKLRAKQAKNREEFLRIEAQRRYQTPAASNYLHYNYGDSGGSLPPPSARPASNYTDSLSSRALGAYVDPLPQYEGSYETSYEKVYDQNPTDSLQSLRSTAYDSYAEGASYSPGPASYSRKQQGYDSKAGYDTSHNAYNRSQVYDTKPYSYGTNSQYPAYG